MVGSYFSWIFHEQLWWPKFSKAPARAPEHQLVLLIFVIVLHVEWLFIVLRVERLFKAQSGPDKGNFWLILTHRSVMWKNELSKIFKSTSSCSAAPARAL